MDYILLILYIHENLNATVDFKEIFNQIIASYGYLGFFIVSFIATLTIVLPVPYLFAIYIAGSTQQFNPAFIGLASGLGAALGELWLYFVGAGGRRVIPEKIMNRADKLRRLIESYGVFYVVFIFAATPLPDDLIYPTLGILKLDIKQIFLAAFLGKTVLAAFAAYAGYYSYDIVLNYLGEESSPLASIVIIILAFVMAYIILRIDWEKYIK